MNCGRSRALRASQSILTAISYGNRANDYYHTRPRLGARLGDAERNDRHRGRSIACRARRLHGRTAAKLCAPSFSGSFFKRFHDEFGAQIWPTVTMISEDAPKSVSTVEALGAFRDAICISAIVSAHARTLSWKRSVGILFAD